MAEEPDADFFQRADAHILLSNEQARSMKPGKVSASMLYGTARFNAWLTACGFQSGGDLAKERKQVIEYFVTEYKKMLEENLDDYIRNFESYMRPKA